MTFRDTRLDETVEKGATGGPQFKTTIVALTSGDEQRNQDWSQARAVYNVSYGIQNKASYQAVLSHFYNMAGQLDSFRFKDWADFQIGDLLDDTTRVPMIQIGATDSYQAIRRYTAGAFTTDRDITKLIAGLKVFDNGIEQTITTHYTVDLNTGIVTFVAPPTTPVELTAEFDVPVRFAGDTWLTEIFLPEAGTVPAISIVEVRLNSE